jgi:hypothetical protein
MATARRRNARLCIVGRPHAHSGPLHRRDDVPVINGTFRGLYGHRAVEEVKGYIRDSGQYTDRLTQRLYLLCAIHACLYENSHFY